ncbi:translational GTPase TypA, partial [Acinetobacter baumannii]
GPEADLRHLFEAIVKHIPPPNVQDDGPFQLQVNNLDYSDYLGRLFGGKVRRGKVRVGDRLTQVRDDGKQFNFNVTKVWI